MIFFWKYVQRILKKLTWMLKPQMLFASSFKDSEDLLGHPTIIYFVSSRVFGKVLTEYWVSVVHSNLYPLNQSAGYLQLLCLHNSVFIILRFCEW